VLLHEIGEHRAGVLLGEAWNRMLIDLTGTPAELMARSVRDHLADCLVTLPTLASEGQPASIHFYLGNLTHMRRELFPTVEAAYRDWLATGSGERLRQAADTGADHWRHVAERMMQLGEPAAIEALREAIRL